MTKRSRQSGRGAAIAPTLEMVVSELRVKLATVRLVLAELEWRGEVDGARPTCPSCGRFRPHDEFRGAPFGHTARCRLAAALRACAQGVRVTKRRTGPAVTCRKCGWVSDDELARYCCDCGHCLREGGSCRGPRGAAFRADLRDQEGVA
jgi:hypothetical protein